MSKWKIFSRKNENLFLSILFSVTIYKQRLVEYQKEENIFIFNWIYFYFSFCLSFCFPSFRFNMKIFLFQGRISNQYSNCRRALGSKSPFRLFALTRNIRIRFIFSPSSFSSAFGELVSGNLTSSTPLLPRNETIFAEVCDDSSNWN